MRKFNTFLFFTFLLAFLLFLLPYTALAQESSEPTPLPDYVAFFPAALAMLVTFNFKVTDIFRRLLASKSVGGDALTPPKDIQGIIVIVFSILVGVLSVWATPNATEWIPDNFSANPILGVIVTGVLVSVLGGWAYDIMKRVNGGNSVFKTTTEINTPPSDTSQKTASETLSVAAQAVNKG
jgi:hypothetical protein